ncbi:MAG: PTS sugar transporter subunit IIB [Deltaproteobacteria bacterium]|jgi:PTS system mannose-specific IIB component|nr:PTS sugar transporter subunit IIB [Deltaproteobacteria bacterium]
MPIILARIDERLIHGQIMASPALSSLRVNQIIVVDPTVRENHTLQCILNSSVQSGDHPIEGVAYLSASELKAFLRDNDEKKKRYLAIFKDLETALEVIRDGNSIPSLNLGNFTSKDPQKKSLTAAFSVGPGESKALNEIHQKVGKIYFDGLNSNSKPYSPDKYAWE